MKISLRDVQRDPTRFSDAITKKQTVIITRYRKDFAEARPIEEIEEK